MRELFDGIYRETLVESDCHLVRVPPYRDTPCSFELVAERVLDMASAAIPHLSCSILAPAEDDWQVWIEGSERDVIRVALHGLHTALAEVVPDLDCPVVTNGDEVGLVRPGHSRYLCHVRPR